jgi:aspartate kinase
MRTSVLKFGGSSFADHAAFHSVARYLAQRVGNGERLTVVVSAMSGTTGRLKEAAQCVNRHYSSEAGDLLLATGEMVSMCLLRMACEKLALRVGSLTGFQLGLTTDDEFGRARVVHKDATALSRMVQVNDVTIICGGQGTTVDNRLTMLGRNSSDLTAILAANMLELDRCEIFSDVPGIYSSDPFLIGSAQCHSEVSYESAITMSKMGAKVLHFGCVVTAQQLDVRIHCRRMSESGSADTGTIIGKTGLAESVVVAKNACHLRPDSQSAGKALQKYFTDSNLNYLPAGPDFFLLDASITEREIVHLGTMATMEHGYLVTSTRGASIVEQKFIMNEREAQEVAEAFHQTIQVPQRKGCAAEDLVKKRSAMSDLLTAAA